MRLWRAPSRELLLFQPLLEIMVLDPLFHFARVRSSPAMLMRAAAVLAEALFEVGHQVGNALIWAECAPRDLGILQEMEYGTQL